jgi:predicted enzyme related to lactoylglutathione lyase
MGLFGWTLVPGEGGYQHLKNGDAFIGGILPASHVPPGTPPNWMSYIQVASIQASTDKARELGATICLGPMSVGNSGSMTVLSDPQGAYLALFEVAHAG